MSAIRDYLSEIDEKFRTGIAGEHAYRAALEALLESADSGISAVNDPARTEIGMPDFVVLRQPGNVPIGIVEAKDISNQLSRTENTKQLKRYLKHGNLILTNYLEFRWYVNGEKRDTVRIARVKNGKIVRNSSDYHRLYDMLSRFARESQKSVNSAQELAQRLAYSAGDIAHYIQEDLKSAAPTASLVSQLNAFRRTLIPDLDPAKFADMFAQTLVYGLFAARMNHAGHPDDFTLLGAAQAIPQTNPFLRRLFFQNSFDLGSRLTWLVEGVVELLRRSDMDSILEHFGRRTQQTDPVVHFYESFLSAYNPKLREQRGVYFTPEPVVKYIVRSVDHILKTRFDRPDGLADTNTLILDPAAGTGTFLYFVIEQIKERLAGQEGAWKDYVEKHLLPRIFGFELLMAPYTIAHMNLSMQLKDAGYEFKENERLGIYLTNALEEGVKEKYESAFGSFIEDEANAAAEIKREKPIMVVLGNPPYAYASQNKGDWIRDRVRDYYFVDGKSLGERNPKALQDDYVKFIRFAQWRISQTGEGVLALITNNSYLDNITFRGMRQHLLSAFDELFLLDLHGNIMKRETAHDGTKDENVFDIQQGVAITIAAKYRKTSETATVMHQDLFGTRAQKYSWLNQHDISDSDWTRLVPARPYYFLVNRDERLFAEYRDYCLVDSAFSERSVAVVSGQDKRVTAIEFGTVARLAAQDDVSPTDVLPINYRPFERRWILYTRKHVERMRYNIMRHLLQGENLCLVFMRQVVVSGGYSHFGVSESLVDYRYLYSNRGGVSVAPLYLYADSSQFDDAGDDPSEFPLSDKGRRPNLSKAFVAEVKAKLGLPFQTEGSAFAAHDQADSFGPEDIFYYAYAIFHSPSYRERYAEFLKIDFPRLPLTADVSLFAALVKLGAELVSLHLMKAPKLADLMTSFPVEGDNVVAAAHPKYVERGGKVYINKRQYFGGVPAEVWDFHIGGYQVLHKWLKDRKGRKLSYDDIRHYQEIVVALSETIRIMSEIDIAIGSFPLE